MCSAVTEDLGADGPFNPQFDTKPPQRHQRRHPRPHLATVLPDGTRIAIAYGFGTDRNGITQLQTTVTDANGKQKESYRDVRELITSVQEFNHGKAIWTSYAYDQLKQIVEVKDAKAYHHRYDQLRL
ncbi:MAG TPA: hypothetical protein VIU93_10980 [Gallionellaceae bacterium]